MTAADHGQGDFRYEHDEVYRSFLAAVNMTVPELERWLATDESYRAGRHGDAGGQTGDEEPLGHQAGVLTLEMLRKDRSELDDRDYAYMTDLVGLIRKTLTRRDEIDAPADSLWRHALMNWGHDPLKELPSSRGAGPSA